MHGLKVRVVDALCIRLLTESLRLLRRALRHLRHQLHVLSLCLVPLPHVTLQSPYSSQGVQAPLTILEKSINIYAIYLLYIKNCNKYKNEY